MFAKHLQIIYIIHICLAAISILLISKVCSEHLRHKAGIWSFDPKPYYVYNQLGNNYLNAYRKLYWYATRHPTLPPRKQRVGKVLIPHAYRSTPRESVVAAQGNQLRNLFKNTNDVALTPSVLGAYLTTAKLLTTAAPKTTAIVEFKKLLPDYKNRTICVENKEPIFSTVATRNPFKIFEDPISTVKIKPTYQTFQPYVAHSFFTLDDVIDPYTPENPTLRTIEYKRAEKKVENNPISAESKVVPKVTNVTAKIFKNDIFDFQPIKYVPPFIRTTTTTTRTTTTEPELTTFAPTKIDVTEEALHSVTTNSLHSENFSNAIEVIEKNSTSKINLFPRKLLKLEKLYNLTCETCGKTDFTTIKAIWENSTQAVDENFTRNSSSHIKKDFGTESKYRKLSFTPNNVTQSHRSKGLPKYGKNLSIFKPTTTTEAPQFKSRRNRTRFINLRRRKLNINSYHLNLLNSSSEKVASPKEEARNQTKIVEDSKLRLGAKLPNSTEPEKVELSKRANLAAAKSTTAPTRSSTSATAKATSEATAFATESAIMTISKTNGRNMKRTQSRYQRKLTNETIASHTDFVQRTDVPKLPIEVYFTKMNPK